MAEIVNLNRARKAKARADKETQAAANRARFGRAKTEKRLEAARSEKADRDHAAHRRDEEQ